MFDVQFPGNWFGFSIILHDFWSSTICAIRIQFSFAQFKNSKNPGIQPNYNLLQIGIFEVKWAIFGPTLTTRLQNLIYPRRNLYINEANIIQLTLRSRLG